MVSMFHSVLQFEFILATSARKMLVYPSRKALSIDSGDEGVHAKQKLGRIKNLQDYYHDRKRKLSFGALTHSSSSGPNTPKAMLLPQSCRDTCPTWRNDHKRNLRLPCARLAFKTDFSKQKQTCVQISRGG